MSDTVLIYTDGAARGNPGPSASGYIVILDGKTIHSDYAYNGEKTNNYAEYNAIIMALQWCLSGLKEPSSLSINLISDSKLVINQLRGDYKVKAAGLKPLHTKARGFLRQFKRVNLENRPREESHIREVDGELNLLLDRIEKEKEQYK